jgi:integrase
MNEATEFKVNQIRTDKVIQIDSFLPNTNKVKKIKSNTSKTKLHNSVQPIKDIEDIERAKQYFLNSNNFRYTGLNIRNYCLFVFGINTGRRISDILTLRVKDIIDSDTGKIIDKFYIHEDKTGKNSFIKLNKSVKEAIQMYIGYLTDNDNSFSLDNYLFKTRESDSSHMTRQQVWNIMKKMSKELDLQANIGATSTRKTFAYQGIVKNLDNPYAVARVSEALNHSSERITRHYIGLDEEEMERLYDGLNL